MGEWGRGGRRKGERERGEGRGGEGGKRRGIEEGTNVGVREGGRERKREGVFSPSIASFFIHRLSLSLPNTLHITFKLHYQTWFCDGNYHKIIALDP